MVNILALRGARWKIAAGIDKRTIIVCINEKKLQHMIVYYNWNDYILYHAGWNNFHDDLISERFFSILYFIHYSLV